MGHALGTTAVAALVWYWLKTYGSEQMGRWVLVGVLVGVAALMRWQSAAFAVLPLGEALGRSLGAGPRQLAGRLLAGLSLAALGAVLAFLPQMAAWRCVYGSWLISPVPLEHHWLKPDFWGVLGSTDRSLWYWTPLTLLALAGFLHLGRPGPSSVRFPAGLLLMVFVVQVYLLASIRGNGVRLGSAFGFRQLTETLVALAPGLALLLERAGTRSFRWLAGGGCLLVAWKLRAPVPVPPGIAASGWRCWFRATLGECRRAGSKPAGGLRPSPGRTGCSRAAGRSVAGRGGGSTKKTGAPRNQGFSGGLPDRRSHSAPARAGCSAPAGHLQCTCDWLFWQE